MWLLFNPFDEQQGEGEWGAFLCDDEDEESLREAHEQTSHGDAFRLLLLLHEDDVDDEDVGIKSGISPCTSIDGMTGTPLLFTLEFFPVVPFTSLWHEEVWASFPVSTD